MAKLVTLWSGRDAMVTFNPNCGRFQFSLRALLVFTTIVAVYFSMGSSIGYVEATGTLASLLLLIAAWRWRRARLLVRVLIGAAAVALLWMAAVDWYWVGEICQDCRRARSFIQIRVYTIPVYEETIREYDTIERVAKDLGLTCLHVHSSRTGLWRRWGLVYPLLLPFCGTRSQLEQHTDWYDDAAAEIVRAKGQASPRIVDEFRQRVLVDHDWQYAETFLAEVRRSRSAQSDQ